MFQRLIGHFVTRTRTLNQLARVTPFIHRQKSLLAAPISCSQTLSSLQFSTYTSAFSHHPVRIPGYLSKNLIVLSCKSSAEGGVCHVYLVGTCHVSKESSRHVQAIVRFLKPQAVFLEVCPDSASHLTSKDVEIEVPTVKEMVTQLRKKENIFSVLLGWFYAKVGRKLGVLPGNEFRVAYEEAIKYGGKVILGDRPDNFRVACDEAIMNGGRVILGDRPVQITFSRMWSKTPLWHKTKLLLYLLFGAVVLPRSDYFNDVKKTDDSDMSKEFPTVMETIVHERDQYMSSTLLKVASENNSVVAVVGSDHLQGIKKYWKQPVVMKDLMTVPSVEPAVSAIKIVRSVVVVVAAVTIISGIVAIISWKK